MKREAILFSAVFALSAVFSVGADAARGGMAVVRRRLATITIRRSTQITAANFNALEVAWRFKTDSLGPRPEYKLEGTPLMVNGVLYTTAGTRRAVVALDAGDRRTAVGAHRARRARAPRHRRASCRAAASPTGPTAATSAFSTSPPAIASSRSTRGPARRIPSFGKDGIVDLKEGVVFGNGQPIDLDHRRDRRARDAGVTSDGVVMIGSSIREGGTPKTHNNTKGCVRGFDVRTGKRLWTFNTIPRPGEFGNETWENESWAVNGNVGVWNQIAVDEELGLAYLPVETPSSDFYGGLRPGNNLFAESIVAVDYQDRPAQVALPARAPSDLEHGHCRGADRSWISPWRGGR